MRARDAARRALRHLALDGLLPALFYLALSRVWHAQAWRGLGQATALSWNLSASDENGTLWFWWWLAQARRRGHPSLFSDVTCLPGGEALQLNHPNRVDAWLAGPLIEALGLPAGYDLFLLLVPVASSLGAWLFLRTLAPGRFVPLVAAAVFGFGGYSVLEATEGRPVSSLLAFVPLALAPWARAHLAPRLGARLAWAAAAGLVLALQAWAYIPYAFFMALAFTVSAAAAAARWRPSAPRWMPALQLLVAGAVSLLATSPYLHELIVVRPGGVQGVPIPAQVQELRWDPGILPELWAVATGEVQARGALSGSRPPAPIWYQAPYWIGVQGESMPWDYLWRGAGRRAHRAVEVPGLFVLGAVLVGLSRRRAWPAALITALTWLFTLGPNAAVRTERAAAELLLVAGHRVVLPTSALLTVAPQIDVYLRPYRLVPFVVLGAAACLVLGAEGWRRRWTVPGEGRSAGWARAPVALGVALGLLGLVQGSGLPGSTWRLFHMGRHPTLLALAQVDPDAVIAELPAGVGHGAGGLQALHGLRRVDPLHDLAGAASSPSPPSCFRGDFAAAMWALGRRDEGARPVVEAGLAEGALAAARRLGVRWIVMYPALYARRPELDRAAAEQELRARLGPPTYADPGMRIWTLP